MTLETDELGERQLREQQAVDRSLAKRSKATRREFEKALARLWLGNAGGAVVAINYVGGSGAARNLSPMPIYFFLTGLVILGVATLLNLVQQWTTIRNNQHATRPLSLKGRYGISPVQWAGSGVNLISAALSALCFVGGCVVGILEFTNVF